MTLTVQASTPSQLVSPGRILRRELDARGWDARDLAEIMARPPQMISQIMTGKKRITEETAIQIGEALQMDPSFWLTLETVYRLTLAKKAVMDDGIARRRRLRELIPCWREVTKRGWLPDSKDLDELERSVCEFLRLKDIADGPETSNFRGYGANDNREMQLQAVWARRVELLAAEKKLPKFSKKRLLESMPDLMALAEDESYIEKVPAFLESLSIAFCIVPHLEKTRLEGAAWPKARNPILALTLRCNHLDSFWTNLLHELGHIAHGHDGVFFDTKDAIVSDDRQEEEANEFAEKFLKRDKIAAFWKRVEPALPSSEIAVLAEDLRMDRCIVIGQLRRISGNYSAHRGVDRNIRHYLNAWIDEKGV